MNTAVGEKYVSELVQLFEKQGPGLYSGQHSLCLTMPCLYYIQWKLSKLEENSTDPVPTGFANLQQLQDCLGRTLALKLIADKRFPLPPSSALSIAPFKALQILTLKKVPIQVITGLQRVRGQLRTLVVQRCHVENLDDVIVRCGGDDSTSFAWSTLRELDLSNNSITELGDSLHYLPCLEIMNISNNSIDGSTDGIECVDSVTHLRLGFNQLSRIPKFGSRAKYTLTVLNLRNNCLDNVEGVQELDSLVELDLTDNLLSRHVSLKPLQNLHHLAMLILVGNPLAFHHKHRLKTAEHLSNLVNPTEFRLDGKKLSSAEKKCISRSLTHYSPLPSSPSTSSPSPSHPSALIRSDVRDVLSRGRVSPRNRPSDGASGSLPIDESVIGKKRRKKARTVALSDSDEERRVVETKDITSTSVPLVHQQRIQDLEHLKKQLQDKWLLSTGSFENTSSTTDSSSGVGRSASQPPKSQIKHHIPPSPSSSSPLALSAGTGIVQERSKLQHRRSQSDRMSIGGGGGRREERELSAERKLGVSSPSSPDAVCGEFFLVERYESDQEEEEEVEQVLVTLSDRFMEERNTNGKTVDRLDLHCLLAASVDSRLWRGGRGQTNMSDVLVLQFNTERRDRRKREYVMMESGDQQKLLDLFHPFIERNLAAFTVASKVECLRCQRTFDSSQTVEQHSEEPQPLSSSISSKETFHDRRPSLSKRMCPFCQSQVLQYVTPKSLPVGSHGSGVLSTSAGLTTSPNVSAREQQPSPIVHVAGKGTTKSGFILGGSGRGHSPRTKGKAEAGDNQSFHNFPVDSGSLEVNCSHSSEHRGQHSTSDEFTAASFHGNSSSCHGDSYPKLSDGMDTSWNYDSQSLEGVERGYLPNRFIRNSDDVLYQPEDSKRIGGCGDVPSSQSDPKARRTSSEPIEVQQRHFGSVQLNPQDLASIRHKNEQRRHSSGEDQMSPWRKPKGSLNPFDADYVPQLASSSSLTRTFDPSNLDLIQEQVGGGGREEEKEEGRKASPSSREMSASHSSGVNAVDECSPGNPYSEERREGGGDSPGRDKRKRRNREGLKHLSSYPRAVPAKTNKHIAKTPRNGPGSYDSKFEDFCFDIPYAEASSSVPLQSDMGAYMGGGRTAQGKEKEREVECPENLGHGRSRSVDYHHSKFTKVTRLPYSDPNAPTRGERSLAPPQQSRSAKSSQGSLDSRGSPRGSRGEVSRGYSSGEQQKRRTNTQSPSDRASRGYSSGEGSSARKVGSTERVALGYSSGERTARGYSSGEQQKRRTNTQSPSDRASRGYSSGEGSSARKVGSTERVALSYSSGERTASSGERRAPGEEKRGSGGERRGSGGERRAPGGERKGYSSGDRAAKGYSSGERRGSGGEKRASSGSDHGSSGRGRGGRVKRGSVEERDRRHPGKENGTQHGSGSLKSSSESATGVGGSGRPALSPSVLVKDEDPSYIYHSLNLHLDMEVFDTDSGEHFKMVFRSPLVQYGQPNEVPSLVIVSTLNIFLYRIVAPESTNPSKWLQLLASHPLDKLVYLDIGVGYQFLRLEFDIPDACYTFLLRDEEKCQLCSTKLAYVVSDTPSSNFRTVGVCPFSLESIRHPDRKLREVVLKLYAKLGGSRSTVNPPSPGADDQVSLYLLAHRHLPGNKEQIPVTLVVTEESLLLAQENFQHWPLSRLQQLPPRELLKPPFSGAMEKDITDIEQIVLDRDQNCHVILKFFKESLSNGESQSWMLIAQTACAVQRLVSSVQRPWEAMMENTLLISYK